MKCLELYFIFSDIALSGSYAFERECAATGGREQQSAQSTDLIIVDSKEEGRVRKREIQGNKVN